MGQRLRVLGFFASAALMTSCGGASTGTDNDAAPSGSSDGGPAADGGLQGDGGPNGRDASVSPDSATGPDAGNPPPSAVRFVAIGDTGEGNENQYLVAQAIKNKCADDGCDFVILLGDNIYDSGVDGVDDEQWQTKFEQPYAELKLPFYPVLGNHDYGGNLIVDTPGLGNEWDKGPIEVAYSQVSSKWMMPATHHSFQVGNVGFIFLDTNSILWDDTQHGDQRQWYPTAVASLASAEWIIVSGHHPYRSNGVHGNAGAYESIEVAGIELPNPLPILNGENVQSFFEEVVCGTANLVLAGHDHNRQWINEPNALCGAELIVSGAGAKVKDFASVLNATHFADALTPGFLYVTIEGTSGVAEFIDMNGVVGISQPLVSP